VNFVRWVIVLVGLAVIAWVIAENPWPAVWREVRCIPTYAFETNVPYPEFLNRLKTGKIKSVQLNPEQARLYVQVDATHRYSVRVPELDATWQDLLYDKRVRVVVLADGGC
jgi:hypothetical protein